MYGNSIPSVLQRAKYLAAGHGSGPHPGDIALLITSLDSDGPSPFFPKEVKLLFWVCVTLSLLVVVIILVQHYTQ